jgi:hypothetical protein
MSGNSSHMTRIGQADFLNSLIEPQGVNAGPAIDAETSWVPSTEPPDIEHVPPPTPYELNLRGPEEMVGLPGQRPGYPGQQRSIETG